MSTMHFVILVHSSGSIIAKFSSILNLEFSVSRSVVRPVPGRCEAVTGEHSVPLLPVKLSGADGDSSVVLCFVHIACS